MGIHKLKKLVVFASTSNRQLIALSLTDGSLKGYYNVTRANDTVLTPSGWVQPPITFSNVVYFIMSYRNFAGYILHSISLDDFIPN